MSSGRQFNVPVGGVGNSGANQAYPNPTTTISKVGGLPIGSNIGGLNVKDAFLLATQTPTTPDFQLQGDNYRTVLGDKGTALLNGADLLVKLAELTALTPFGLPLSATNQVTLLVMSGYYNILQSLNIPSFVNVIGICEDKTKTNILKISNSKPLFNIQGDYHSIQNLSLKSTSSSDKIFNTTSSYPNSTYKNLSIDFEFAVFNATTNSGKYIDIEFVSSFATFFASAGGTPTINSGYFKNITCLNNGVCFDQCVNGYFENINVPFCSIAQIQTTNSTFKNITCDSGFRASNSFNTISGIFQDILITNNGFGFSGSTLFTFTGSYKNITSTQGNIFINGNTSGTFENIKVRLADRTALHSSILTSHTGTYKNIEGQILFGNSINSGTFTDIKGLDCFNSNTFTTANSGVFTNVVCDNGFNSNRIDVLSNNSGIFKNITINNSGFQKNKNSGVFDNIQGIACFNNTTAAGWNTSGKIKNSSFSTTQIEIVTGFEIFNCKIIFSGLGLIGTGNIRSYNNAFNRINPYSSTITNLITESAAGNIKDTNIS